MSFQFNIFFKKGLIYVFSTVYIQNDHFLLVGFGTVAIYSSLIRNYFYSNAKNYK